MRALTVHGEGEVAAVELVLGRDLAPVGAREVGLGGQDQHLKGVDLQEGRDNNAVEEAAPGIWRRAPDVSSPPALVPRSYASFSCRCFPDLLARSIHFPLNHFTEGFFSSDSAFTLAVKVMLRPAGSTVRVGDCGLGYLRRPAPTYGDLAALGLLCEESGQVLPGVRRVSVCGRSRIA